METYTGRLERPDSYIQNLAYSVFYWDGIPEQIVPDTETLERMLIKFGMVADFRDARTGQLYILPFTGIQFNMFGGIIPELIQPMPINASGTLNIIRDSSWTPHILFDQPNHKSINESLDYYIDNIGYLDALIRIYANMIAYPTVFFADKKNKKAVELLTTKLIRGLPGHIFLEGSIDLQQALQSVDLGVSPSGLDAITKLRDSMVVMAFEEIGIPDLSSVKMAQQTKTEVLMPTLPTSLKSRQRLVQRQRFLTHLTNDIELVYGVKPIMSVICNSLSLVQASLLASTGRNVDIVDYNNNGVDDRMEVRNDVQ